MPNAIMDIKSSLNTILIRSPALKKKILTTMTNVFINSPPEKLRFMMHIEGEMETNLADMLTTYVKRNPSSENSLPRICDNIGTICDITIETLNTKTSNRSHIEYGFGKSFTSPSALLERIKKNLSEE